MSNKPKYILKGKEKLWFLWNLGLPSGSSRLIPRTRSFSETFHQAGVYTGNPESSGLISDGNKCAEISRKLLLSLQTYHKMQKAQCLMIYLNYWFNFMNHIKFEKLKNEIMKSQSLLSELKIKIEEKCRIIAKLQKEMISLNYSISQKDVQKIFVMQENHRLQELLSSCIMNSKENTELVAQNDSRHIKWIRIYLGMDCIISTISFILILSLSKGLHSRTTILWLKLFLGLLFSCKMTTILQLLNNQFKFPVSFKAMSFLMKKDESCKQISSDYLKQAIINLC